MVYIKHGNNITALTGNLYVVKEKRKWYIKHFSEITFVELIRQYENEQDALAALEYVAGEIAKGAQLIQI